MRTTPSLRGADQLSTPARRRRIVADVAKLVVRNYLRIACINATSYRRRGLAAVTLQQNIRFLLAQLSNRRTRKVKLDGAALIIQLHTRVFLAKSRVSKHRHKVRWESALVIRRAWICYCHRIVRSAVRQRIEVESRITSATQIQQFYRRYVRRQLDSALLTSVITLQCSFRILLAKGGLRRLRKTKNAKSLLQRKIMSWWRLRSWSRLMAARVLQKCFRRRLVVKATLLIAVSCRAVQCFWRCCMANARVMMVTKYRRVDDTRDILEVSTLIENDMLQHLAELGSARTFRWFLNQDVVRFHEGEGFSVGAALQQVIHVAEKSFIQGSLEMHDMISSAVTHDVIKSDARPSYQIEEGAFDLFLPVNWNHECFIQEGLIVPVNRPLEVVQVARYCSNVVGAVMSVHLQSASITLQFVIHDDFLTFPMTFLGSRPAQQAYSAGREKLCGAEVHRPSPPVRTETLQRHCEALTTTIKFVVKLREKSHTGCDLTNFSRQIPMSPTIDKTTEDFMFKNFVVKVLQPEHPEIKIRFSYPKSRKVASSVKGNALSYTPLPPLPPLSSSSCYCSPFLLRTAHDMLPSSNELSLKSSPEETARSPVRSPAKRKYSLEVVLADVRVLVTQQPVNVVTPYSAPRTFLRVPSKIVPLELKNVPSERVIRRYCPSAPFRREIRVLLPIPDDWVVVAPIDYNTHAIRIQAIVRKWLRVRRSAVQCIQRIQRQWQRRVQERRRCIAAAAVQVAVRRFLAARLRAATLLQRVWRRSSVIAAWHGAVCLMLSIADRAAELIQSVVRMFLNVRRSYRRREEVCRETSLLITATLHESIKRSKCRWDIPDPDTATLHSLRDLVCPCERFSPSLGLGPVLVQQQVQVQVPPDSASLDSAEQELTLRGVARDRAEWVTGLLGTIGLDMGDERAVPWGVPPGCLLSL